MASLLTPKDCVSANLHKELEEFLSRDYDQWGQKTMLKDLGSNVLTLVSNSENNNPWEYDNGPSFLSLDDELAVAKVVWDYLINVEVLLPVRNSQELAKVLHQKHDRDGHPIGKVNPNPAFHMHMYEVLYLDP